MSKPVAYAAVAADGSESVYVASLKEQAEACCRENGWFLLPLYAAPPTWQEEVAAVEAAFEKSGVKPIWPDDEAGNIGPMAAAMADEIGRLRVAIRRLADQDATPSVREGNVTVDVDFTLTAEERQLFVRLVDRFESLSHFFDTPSGANRQAKEACDRDVSILKSFMEKLI
jgi:hypothetical protein